MEQLIIKYDKTTKAYTIDIKYFKNPIPLTCFVRDCDVDTPEKAIYKAYDILVRDGIIEEE